MGIGKENAMKEERRPTNEGSVDDAMVQLMDFWLVVKRRKRFIGRFVLAVLVLTVVSTLLMEDVYQATAVISPIAGKDNGGTLSTLAQQFGGIAGHRSWRSGQRHRHHELLNSKILRGKNHREEQPAPIVPGPMGLETEPLESRAARWHQPEPSHLCRQGRSGAATCTDAAKADKG